MKKLLIKTTSLLLLLAICLFSLCSCETWNNFRKAFIDPPEEVKKVIKIGVLEPYTGRQSYNAEDEIAGIELAHEMFPELLGYEISLVYEDNRSDNEICKEATKKLINSGCSIILGSVSDTLSLAASDVIKEAEVPAIAATCTVPILTKTNPYYFRASYINSFDAEGAADYAINGLNASSVLALIPEDDDYAIQKFEIFQSSFNTELEPIIAEAEARKAEAEKNKKNKKNKDDEETEEPAIPSIWVEYFNDSFDEEAMKAIFQMMLDNSCTTVYFPCKSEVAVKWIEAANRFFTEAKSKDTQADKGTNKTDTSVPEKDDGKDNERYNIHWIGTERWIGIENVANEKFSSTAFLTGIEYTIDYDPDAAQTEMSTKFLAAYNQKYGADSKPSNNFALGFDAYLMAYEGLKNLAEKTVSEDGEISYGDLPFNEEGILDISNLRNSLLSIRDLQAVTGSISVDANGDPAKDILIRKYNGTQFSIVYTAHPNLNNINNTTEGEE